MKYNLVSTYTNLSQVHNLKIPQKKHHEIIESNKHNPQIQQTSLAELHKLSITLSNLYDVAPSIVNGITLSATPETKTVPTEAESIITVWYLKG